jgi:murein DD-endopeptidase MepM/ murein hydrolase activator NlpD
LLALVVAVIGGERAGAAVGALTVLLPPDVRYQQTAPGALTAQLDAEQATSGDAAYAAPAAATTEPVPEELFAYTTHEVAAGETLSGIGAQYGVDVQYLIWNNPEVGTDPDMLVPGENLLVPGTPGIVYDVRLGDTITEIAATYSVDPAEIVAFAPNGLESPDMIQEGSVLVLPGAVPPPPPPPVEETPAPATPEPTATPSPAQPPIIVTPAPEPPAAPVAGVSTGFIWPVNGTLNSRFGMRWGSFHSGIDIGAGGGTAVSAGAGGQVVLASYSSYGYGNYIIIRHTDGTQTLYAHLSRIYVSLGQQVAQGEVIGAVGCTGWCTGPHLHFEVRAGATPVDPLLYLP